MIISHEGIDIELKGPFSDDMSDEEFFNFCIQNDNQRIERDENGQIYIMAPVNPFGSNQNFTIAGELYKWHCANKIGYCFESSAGFTLPDGSIKSPDASWIKLERWNNLPNKIKKGFPSVCPDFVIELKSPTDSIRYLKSKMLKWMENGCELAWLIIPDKQEAHIYRSNGSIEILLGFDKKLSGENVLSGFELDLNLLQ